ncbi:MAG: glycine cleavage system protein H [Gammaproteobacteria bacterium]|nr:glycine cleavage system protein H [Gammaproteobacteria bacterium]MAQ67589.1 glycine cleavage system protein H [Gammaproteobacteria bacterium]MBS27001.1 glycine cleavage system protein H [Gammaproteobacteria bacterium]
MSNIPDDLKYASTHEWISVNEDGLVTVGISDHAQEALGDIVFVELPEAGASVNSKEEVAVVESVKAASDIYSPLTGEVVEINESLLDSPETVNASPYELGWFFKIRMENEAELDDLMNSESYSEYCDNE